MKFTLVVNHEMHRRRNNEREREGRRIVENDTRNTMLMHTQREQFHGWIQLICGMFFNCNLFFRNFIAFVCRTDGLMEMTYRWPRLVEVKYRRWYECLLSIGSHGQISRTLSQSLRINMQSVDHMDGRDREHGNGDGPTLHSSRSSMVSLRSDCEFVLHF